MSDPVPFRPFAAGTRLRHPLRAPRPLPTTVTEATGPRFTPQLFPGIGDLTRMAAGAPLGERIIAAGRVTGGAGEAVADAAVEIWQASPAADARFPGYGRSATDGEGRFRFVTLRPGPVPGHGDRTQAPRLAVVLLARGLMTALHTRLCFEGEALNRTDPLLASIADPAERASLIAQPAGAGAGAWRPDIRLQGPGETVFLAV